MWEHAEGMNETEQRTWVRCFLAHLAISSYHNGLSRLVQQHIALEQTNTYCHGPECHLILGGFRRGRAISALYPALDTDVDELHPRYRRISLHCAWLKRSELYRNKRFRVAAFLRVWHWIPSHCGGQWQVLGPIHSPPFLHSWRQIAAQTSSHSYIPSVYFELLFRFQDAHKRSSAFHTQE